MKKLKVILIILLQVLVFIFSAFVFRQTYVIIPGKQVGPFSLRKTTIKEIEAIFGKGKLTLHKQCTDADESGFSAYCPMTIIYKFLDYKEKGIVFRFDSEEFWSDAPKNKENHKYKLNHIEITKRCDAQTDKGISVYSTRDDIYKAYGRQAVSNRDTIKTLIFDGIYFNFGNVIKPQLTDTLTSIVVY